jgi:hypothetical protein
MKRYKIEIKIEDMLLYVYVEAKLVLKVSHERLMADGITIDLPGEIVGAPVILD